MVLVCAHVVMIGIGKGRLGIGMALEHVEAIPYGHAAFLCGGYKLLVMHCNVT